MPFDQDIIVLFDDNFRQMALWVLAFGHQNSISVFPVFYIV